MYQLPSASALVMGERRASGTREVGHLGLIRMEAAELS